MQRRARGGRNADVARRTDDDIHTVGTDQVLWRVHATSGQQVRPWNQLRYFGPVASRSGSG